MSILLILFVLRVLAQLSSSLFELPWLPRFEYWYSGTIAYPLLVGIQVVIITLMLLVTVKFARNKLQPRYGLGMVLLGIGGVYFLVMFVRLVIGLIGFSELLWFNRPIPAFFHLVLALYIMLTGHFHMQRKVLFR